MPKISVIMPVYNVEKYLRECLDSVLAQTMRDFEVICVDDSSTDGSAAILDEYAKRDTRVRVFRRPHSNAGAARNFGMSVANGEYYIFLDSDDYFSPWMFETLLNGITQENADIAACDSIWFKDGIEHPTFVAPENVVWSDATVGIVERGFFKMAITPWNKIFNRHFIDENKIRWQEIKSTNDLYFSMMALSRSLHSVYASVALVAYRLREKSLQATKGKNPENFCHAVNKYCVDMDNGQFWKIKKHTKAHFFEFLSSIAIFELDSQPSLGGYLRMAYALQCLGQRCGIGDWIQHDGCDSSQRYAKVMRRRMLNWFVWVANAFVHGTISRGGRTHGCRLRVANFAMRVLKHFKIDM